MSHTYRVNRNLEKAKEERRRKPPKPIPHLIDALESKGGRVLLPRLVKLKRNLRVNANRPVIVHHFLN
jgi:hypothetical protein